MKHHWKKVVGIAGCSLCLSACHHDNPLLTHSKSQSAIFLMNASANAEKRLKFAVKKDEYGFGYLECMEEKNYPEMNCNALYQGMVAFAKEKHYVGFEKLTLADLTDQVVFDELGDDYAEVMVSTWPQYYSVG